VVDGLKVAEGSMQAKTIRHWAEDAFTWAAGKKGFTDLAPIQCAVGFKLVDWEMGGYDTARMLAEHPKIRKVGRRLHPRVASPSGPFPPCC
jgi:hypothetical protein